MRPSKNTLLLLSFFVIAFYASSSGYADKTFIPKEKQVQAETVTEEQLLQSSVQEIPEPEMTTMKEPTEMPTIEVEETTEVPNHPKRYAR